MKFRDLVNNTKTEAPKEPGVLEESVSGKVAKEFLEETIRKNEVQFNYVITHRETGKTEKAVLKISSGEALKEFSGGTKMLDNDQVVAMIKQDKKTIEEWKNWMLKESLVYIFEQNTVSGSRVGRYIESALGKKSWDWAVTEISYNGTVFWVKKEKAK